MTEIQNKKFMESLVYAPIVITFVKHGRVSAGARLAGKQAIERRRDRYRFINSRKYVPTILDGDIYYIYELLTGTHFPGSLPCLSRKASMELNHSVVIYAVISAASLALNSR